MTDTVDIYNQEQITAALGAIKTALDSLISAGIPVDLTGYVRTDHTGDIEIDGIINIIGDKLIFGGSSGLSADPTTATATMYNRAGIGFTISAYQAAIRTGSTPVERFRVTPSGNILIGSTTDNDNRLQVTSNGTNAGLTVDEASPTGGVVASFGGAIEVTDGGGGVLFTISSSGVLNAPNLPTSSSGLSAGDIYRDGAGANATLKIV